MKKKKIKKSIKTCNSKDKQTQVLKKKLNQNKHWKKKQTNKNKHKLPHTTIQANNYQTSHVQNQTIDKQASKQASKSSKQATHTRTHTYKTTSKEQQQE